MAQNKLARNAYTASIDGNDYLVLWNPTDEENVLIPVNDLQNIVTPASEDEVIFVNTYASLPVTGIQERIYVCKDNYSAYLYQAGEYQRINRYDVIDVTTISYNYVRGDVLHITLPNTTIILPNTPRGTSIKVINGSSTTNTIIQGSINGSSSFNELYNPNESIELISLGTEYKVL